MVKITRTLSNYINKLPLTGGISLVCGLAFAIVMQTSNNSEVWALNYLPGKLVGSILGYIWANHWSPGGFVTFHFTDNFVPTQDEKAIDKIIRRYKSNLILIAIPIIYILIDIINGNLHSPYLGNITFDGYFGSAIYSLWVVTTIVNGGKYLSAWWNFKHKNKR